MPTNAKTILIWTIVVVAVLIIIYGSIKLLSPGYIDKTKYVAKNPPFDLNKPMFGGYNWGSGVNMSKSESYQKYSPYAPGQNPEIQGSADLNPPPQITVQGTNDLFTMFQV